MKKGDELFCEVFGEDVFIEDVLENVDDYEENIDYNSGWYNHITATFKFNDELYSIKKREHTSDNVCDVDWDMDSFKKAQKMVTITQEEYEMLLDDSEFLSCLEACGVDNWHGYGEAREMMNEGE